MFPFRRRPVPSRARRRVALRFDTFEDRTVPAVAVGVNLNSTQNDQAPPVGNSGAVGPNHYVHFTTGQFTVYDKTGSAAPLVQITDRAFWQAAGIPDATLNDLLSQPRVAYDPLSDRWFAAAITLRSTGNAVLLARSDTSSPASPWKAVSYNATNPFGTGTDRFGNFPTLAVDATGVYVGTGNFSTADSGGTPVGSTMTSIPKADLTQATPSLTRMTSVTQAGATVPMGWSPQAVTNFDPNDTTASVIATHYTSFDLISHWEIAGAGGAGATFGPTSDLGIPHNALPGKARQPNGTQIISGGDDDRYTGAAFQVGDLIYAVHTISVDANGNGTDVNPFITTYDGLQLIVIRDSTNTVVATKNFFSPGYDYTYPSVAANAYGDIVIGFNRSGGAGSLNGNLGAYAIHARLDPAAPATGVTQLALVELQAGLFNGYNLTGSATLEPWGPYSATAVDPADPFAFWTTLQFANKNATNESMWGTKVSQVLVSPRALTVSTSTPNGTYGAGTQIPITIAFNGVVTVTGTPRLALNSGGTAVYTGGSGSNVLTFTYTVGPGDSTADLDYTAAGIDLNGGTINHVVTGGFGVPAELTLPAPGTAGSLGANVNIVITPTQTGAAVTGVTSTTANGTYGPGAVISITVDFSRDVTVSGTPQLALNSGGTATYASGSGTSTLTFTYTVAAGHSAADLDYTSTGALTGGTITDEANGTPADLTLPAPGAAGSLGANKDIVIQVPPAGVTNVTSPKLNGSYGTGAVIDVTVQFSRAVTVTGSPQLALNTGGTATFLSANGSTLTFRYTVASGENVGDLDYASTGALTGGTIQDANGQDVDRTLPAPGTAGSLGANKALRIDTVGPQVLAFRVLYGSKKYNLLGAARTDLPWLVKGVQVVFSEPVTAGNVRSLTGLPATRLSGLRTRTLTWNFAGLSNARVTAGLADSGLNALKDASGNPIAAFSRAFTVLYGDFDGNGRVEAADEAGVRDNMVSPYQLRPTGYNIFADLSGDGLVNLVDVGITRTRRGATLL